MSYKQLPLTVDLVEDLLYQGYTIEYRYNKHLKTNRLFIGDRVISLYLEKKLEKAGLL